MSLVTIAACVVALLAVLAARNLLRRNRHLRSENAKLVALTGPAPRKSAEQQQSERLERQLRAVLRENVTFSTRRVMGGGELDVFYAALNVTDQKIPSGPYPYYVFPQVSLGQVIRAEARWDWQSDQAHRAINSKRCDLLVADRTGHPVAVLEYQGAGHNIGGTAERRDEIKRIALESAGVRFVEIKDGTDAAEIRRTIRSVLDTHTLGRHRAAFTSGPAQSPNVREGKLSL